MNVIYCEGWIKAEEGDKSKLELMGIDVGKYEKGMFVDCKVPLNVVRGRLRESGFKYMMKILQREK